MTRYDITLADLTDSQHAGETSIDSSSPEQALAWGIKWARAGVYAEDTSIDVRVSLAGGDVIVSETITCRRNAGGNHV